jgi:hypothetical protein
MSIRDRGKKKWQGAFFMPEHVKMLHHLQTDYFRMEKPVLDALQYEEFDERMEQAMNSNDVITTVVWQNGFTSEYTGKLVAVDVLKRQLRMEISPGKYQEIRFDEIVNIIEGSSFIEGN